MSLKRAGLIALLLVAGCARNDAPAVSLARPDGLFGGARLSGSNPLLKRVVGIRFPGANGEVETCTGAIIGPRQVLTAAHCAQQPAHKIEVVYRHARLNDASRAVSVRAVKVHRLYRARAGEIQAQAQWEQVNQYDLAVLRLAKDLPGAMPFKFSRRPHAKEAAVWVAGFGYSSFDLLSGQRGGEPELAIARLVSVRAEQPGVLLVDQSRGKGVCVGDSGAPVMVRGAGGEFRLIGLVSSVRHPGSSEPCTGIGRLIEVRANRLAEAK